MPALRLDLRAALYQAFHKAERSVSRTLHVELAGKAHLLHLHVGPINEPGFPKGYVEVVFVAEEGTDMLELTAKGETIETDLVLVMRMEEELIRTRERLQTIIEEHENSSQELKTSNEELQSINEELKSTTEELETSKEELQSMNEELVTMNSDLTEKIDALNHANGDLHNLIASTDVGTIFLDAELRLSRFTPRAIDLFNLIDSDHGRPFAHVTHRIRHSSLAHLAATVLETAERIEETVQDEANHWYIMRLFPYRTVAGKLDGVVLSFVDINDLKRAESEERQRVQQQMLAALGRQGLANQNLDELFQTATQQVAAVLEMEFCKVLELLPNGEALRMRAGVGWQAGLVGQATVPADTRSQAGYTLQAMEPVVVRDTITETRFHGPDLLIEHGVRSGMSVTIYGPDGPFGVLGVHSRTPRNFATYDIDFLQSVANTLAAAIVRHRTVTELRTNEAALRRYVDMLQASYDAILVWHPQSGIEFWNHGAEELYGFSADEAIGQITHELLHTQHPESLAAIMARLESDGAWEGELVHQTKDGHTVYVSTRHQLIVGDNGDHVILEINRDITAQKAAETARRQSEEQARRHLDELEAIYNTAPVGLCVLDRELRWVHINERLAEINGFSAADHIGRTVRELLPNIADEVEPTLREILETGKPVLNVELIGETPAQPGVQRTWVESWFPMFSENGQVIGINVVAEEVTEQKRAAEALRHSEAQARRHLDELEAIYNTAPIGLCVMDRELRYVRINDRLAAMNGLPAADHIGRTGREVLPDLADKTEHRLQQIFATGEPVIGIELSGEIPTEPGVQHTWIESWLPLHNEDGEVVAVNIVIEEITERKRAEEALRESEARFRNMADTAPAMLWITDATGYCTFLSRGWYEFTGQTEENGLGYGWTTAVHPDDDSHAHETFLAATRTQQPFSIDYRLRRADGSYGWAIDTGHPRFDADGFFLGHIGAVIDIHERKEAEEALRRSEERYRYLFETMDEGFCVIDMIFDEQGAPIDYRFLESNPAFEEFTGLKQAVGRTARELVPNLERDWFEIYGKVVTTGEPIRFEQGSEAMGRWFDVYAFRVGDEESRRVAILFNNTTERKQMELALAQSNAILTGVIESNNDAIFVRDLEGRYLLVNAAGAAQVGMAKEAIIGQNYRDLFTSAEVAAMAIDDRPVVEEGLTQTIEQVSAQNGVTRHWHTLKMPLRNEEGAITGLISSARDMTEHIRAEEELRRSYEILALAQRVSQSGVWDWDIAHNHTFWSAGYYALYGFHRRRNRAMSVDPRHSPRRPERIDMRLREVLDFGWGLE
ncbi:MAG: PAS domain S-box protein [Caldilineaceae bacterium]